jgi:hypothetical protein
MVAEDRAALTYNYPAFTSESASRLMRFDESPGVGSVAPDFTLTTLEGEETALHAALAGNRYTVVEFGSYT